MWSCVIRKASAIITPMGYQPEEFQKLYVERTEVMDALEESIIAVNTEENIILINSAARAILQLPEETPAEGCALSQIFPDERLQEVLKTGTAEYNISQIDYSTGGRPSIRYRLA